MELLFETKVHSNSSRHPYCQSVNQDIFNEECAWVCEKTLDRETIYSSIGGQSGKANYNNIRLKRSTSPNVATRQGL